MKTYQDLIPFLNDEDGKAKFCANTVDSFKMTNDYMIAHTGEMYYDKHNETIEKFQKFIYTVSGNKVPDIFSPNYKIKSLIFRRLCTQQVQYVLGNGMNLSVPENKNKLGSDFDFRLQECAKRALAGGTGFGFWNYDHLEVFGYADTPKRPGFCPLYDEETGKLRAGIRFWSKKVGDKSLYRYTLYEDDGYTEYSKLDNKDIQIIKEKQAYMTVRYSNGAGMAREIGENYGTLPIVPMYANDTQESELVGIRESIDCIDFITSGFANDIDNAGLYWVLKNSGGMDDVDLARFMQRLRSVRGAVLDSDDDVDAQVQTLDIPVDARKTMLEILRESVYEDFQALDVKTLSAAAKTTQEIQSAYQIQDNKCADFEYYVLDFCQQILKLAGINDNPTFVWNKVLNQSEQTNMILSASNYLSTECIIRHLPFLTPEEADEEIKIYQTEQSDRFNNNNENFGGDTE